MLRLFLVFKNTWYAFTNKRVLFRSGFWGTSFTMVDYDKIQDISVKVNPFENLCSVGTVKFFSGGVRSSNNFAFFASFGDENKSYDKFIAIREPYKVFKAVKEVEVDIKTDFNFPNKLRPDENPGYNTEYKKKNC